MQLVLIKKLKELYLENAKTFDSCATKENADLISCSQILTYKTYTYNNILSVVVIYATQSTSTWVLNYNTYNFNLRNGELLTYDNVLSKLGYNRNDTI